MALEGTLRDFSLADIFQLIGLQRKTGVLTLKGPEDTVTIPFETGQIVGAESEIKHLEDRLGHVLCKTGKLDPRELERVLRLQRETGQRIGDLLMQAAAITRDDLSRALQLQVTQIIYRLFRWSEGDFRFAQTSRIEYDRNSFRPIPVENILMEGLRILDEWPLIEKRVNSFSMVFFHADDGLTVRPEAEEGGESDSAEDDGETVTVSESEAVVYTLVDGHHSVQDIIDRSELGEFETCKAIFELLEKDLLGEAVGKRDAQAAAPQRHNSMDRAAAFATVLVATTAFLAGTAYSFQSPQLRLLAPIALQPAADQLRLLASQARLARLEFAVRLYALQTNRYPAGLVDLVHQGLLTPRDLMDPWGTPYEYLLSRRNYQLRGLDAGGRERAELILTGPVTQPGDGEAPQARLGRQ